MKNVKLTLSYDGTEFTGWQSTGTHTSIEEHLSVVLKQILQEDVALQAASRTDAGVHATGQIVNFLTARSILEIDKFRHSLNALLPPSIRVLDTTEMNPNFHPTLDAKVKEYHYSLCFDKVQLPFRRFYEWHYPFLLNLRDMREATAYFEGTHDFASFCNMKKNEKYTHHLCTIDSIDIQEVDAARILLKIRGNRFLYKMVRNIVGTLVYVGQGKMSVNTIPELLQAQDRTQAGVTAPAHGLNLFRISY